ncbi:MULTISPECIES: acylphosphatase [unclassified Gordonia (in: high G+C Gram-positive bacteria)]|uniref:acylphosphatase n=1 Tax=unclassified Gordonia (in: high G+C Gram-positive bacteria) TaxID=2657482 RepID=UPI001F0E0BB9|nr:acylphosphatase [Gordonia sp. ABSL49_1]MCH5645540.1 acylphosphatase [Gordonia sp. ABSL49_1]
MSDKRHAEHDPPDPDQQVRLIAHVHGRVQGVGFRWWTRSRALELGLAGYASNQPDGRVLVVAEGTRRDVAALVDLLRSGQTPGRVSLVVDRLDIPRGDLDGFAER